MKNLELIAALGKATGPDRTLDRSISCFICDNHPDGQQSYPLLVDVPLYSQSIDAAMTLVPEGYQIVDWMIGTDGSSCLDLWKITPPCEPRSRGSHQHSAAIALCIAALKARAQTGGGK